MSSLQEKYKNKIFPELKKKFGFKNILDCPRPDKIVVNVGIGQRVVKDPSKRDDLIKKISNDLALITGQKPHIRKARKSISGFSVREKMPVGLRVTLRGKRMNQFLDKLINAVLPRIRDFQGINESSVDGEGNLTIGIKEQLVFPEISSDDVDVFFGMEITIVTTKTNREESLELLKMIGIPFTTK